MLYIFKKFIQKSIKNYQNLRYYLSNRLLLYNSNTGFTIKYSLFILSYIDEFLIPLFFLFFILFIIIMGILNLYIDLSLILDFINDYLGLFFVYVFLFFIVMLIFILILNLK